MFGASGCVLLAWAAFCAAPRGVATATRPTTAPALRLPHIQVDLDRKRVEIDCEAVVPPDPLEFVLCLNNTVEHESLLRTQARASHIHMGLLLLGLEPGRPLREESPGRWRAPEGPRLRLEVEWEQEGRTLRRPVHELLRPVRGQRAATPPAWVFVGSRIMDDGNYAADITGYLVTLVNFELALIDVSELASSSNEQLLWAADVDRTPRRGQKVRLIIEPLPGVERGKAP